jgi:SAM domain (Sterile alpha motif)
MDVMGWLRKLGLARYEAAFRNNDSSGDLVTRLTGEDLKEIGAEFVDHRRRSLCAIAAH